jgi:hypothetical protein
MARRKTDDELKQIAIDILEGRIFTDQMVRELDKNGPIIGSIFMPLLWGALKDTPEEELKDIAIIYEYLDKAAPRSVNGYPTFFSFCIMGRDDFEVMYEFGKAYKKMRTDFKNSSSHNDGGI